GEPRLEEVVEPGRGERPRQQPSEAGGEHLRRRQAGRRPGPPAAAAGDELAERLLPVARLDRLLVAFVSLAADEGVAEEARHLVAGERPRGLEGGYGQHAEVEGGLALRVAVEQPA